nr:hypothetical protein [Leadbetterella byssophila]
MSIYQPGLFIPIAFELNFPKIHWVFKRPPKSGFSAFQAFSGCPLVNLFNGIDPGSDFFKSLFEQTRLWLVDGNILSSRFGDPVDVPYRSNPHVSPFFLGTSHASDRIEGTPVIFYFRCGHIEGQHHFIFRDREVKRLLNGLWFGPQFSQNPNHMIGIACIPAKPVPFGKQNQVYPAFCFFEIAKKPGPCRSFKSFGRMVFINNLADRDPVDFTVFAEHFLLSTLGVTFISLLVSADPDV